MFFPSCGRQGEGGTANGILDRPKDHLSRYFSVVVGAVVAGPFVCGALRYLNSVTGIESWVVYGMGGLW